MPWSIQGPTFPVMMKVLQNCGWLIGLIGLSGVCFSGLKAQLPSPALVGYWHNWNDSNAPYLPLDAVDDRYNVVVVAFAMPVSPTDMTLTFVPEGTTEAAFVSQIQSLQDQGKRVLLSIGGATATIDLTTVENKDSFVASANALLDAFGFDGLDIDIEYGASILVTGGTLEAPANGAQVHLIEAIEEIMANHRATHGEKMLLTMAPETAYVQGGQSAFGSIWGGYLPVIHALRDSLDLLQVQLYNSGSMLGVDQQVYTQGTADFVVAMTDAVIEGFSTAGGAFPGLPAHKVAVGLPACPSAAGGGYLDPAGVAAAVGYLLGNAPQPGAYVLANGLGHPGLGGMMTWSINWDAASGCGGTYAYAETFAGLFGEANSVGDLASQRLGSVYPNPSSGRIQVPLPPGPCVVRVTDLTGAEVCQIPSTAPELVLELEDSGVYLVTVASVAGAVTHRVVVNR